MEVRPSVRVCGWGLGPVRWRGSPSVEVRPWAGVVGAGPGLCGAGGRLGGQRVRPGSPTGSPGPKWTGTALAAFPPVPPRPSRTMSPRVSPVIAAGPLTVGGSAGRRNSSPPPAAPRDAGSEVGPLLVLPLPSLPLPHDPRLEGASAGRGSGPGSQQATGCTRKDEDEDGKFYVYFTTIEFFFFFRPIQALKVINITCNRRFNREKNNYPLILATLLPYLS